MNKLTLFLFTIGLFYIYVIVQTYRQDKKVALQRIKSVLIYFLVSTLSYFLIMRIAGEHYATIMIPLLTMWPLFIKLTKK